MSDSETPQHKPEGNGAPGSSFAGGASSLPEQSGQGSDPSAIKPQGGGGSRQTRPPGSGGNRLGRLHGLARGGKAMWASLAVLCVAAGTVGSVLAAQRVANSNAAKA